MESMLNTQESLVGNRRNRRSSDRGSVLVMAAIISVVAFALAGVILSHAQRQSSASNTERFRQQSIDAAMAGAVVANSALTTNAAYTGSGLVTVADGSAQFEVHVATDATVAGSARRVLTSTGYSPTKAAPKVVRTFQQEVELDPVGFTYGIFLEGSYSDASSSSVIGSIYTGGSISLGNAHDLTGNLDAIGSISTGSNQNITGTLHANGSVSVGNTSTNVYGSVLAGGSITTGGIVRDVAQAGGSVTNCAKVQGSCIQHSPPPLVPVQFLPPFTFNAANYASVSAVTSGAAFATGVKNKTLTQGVFNINGSVSFNNNETLELTGDMTIFVSGSITLPGTISGPVGSNVQLTLIVRGSASAPTNLTIPSTIKTLIYTNGSFSAGNKLIFTGVLYTHGSFSMGANSSITYAPVSAPGFDWTQSSAQSYTIRNITTRETT